MHVSLFVLQVFTSMFSACAGGSVRVAHPRHQHLLSRVSIEQQPVATTTPLKMDFIPKVFFKSSGARKGLHPLTFSRCHVFARHHEPFLLPACEVRHVQRQQDSQVQQDTSASGQSRGRVVLGCSWTRRSRGIARSNRRIALAVRSDHLRSCVKVSFHCLQLVSHQAEDVQHVLFAHMRAVKKARVAITRELCWSVLG